MDYTRRPDCTNRNLNSGLHQQVQGSRTDSFGGQRRCEYEHQSTSRSSQNNDDGALNLDSVFVNTNVHQQSFQLYGRADNSSHNSASFGRQHRHIQEYYNPMYPTGSSNTPTPSAESNWGPHFTELRGGYPMEGSQVPISSIHFQSPNAGSSSSGQFRPSMQQMRPHQREIINQFGFRQDSQLLTNDHMQSSSNLPQLQRTSQIGRDPGRLDNLAFADNNQRTARGFQNSEMKAISLSLNTSNIKMASQREVVPKANYLSLNLHQTENSIFAKNPYLDATATGTKQSRSGVDYLNTVKSSSPQDEGRTLRVRVFTDVVTHICQEYGFVGPEVFFQTSAVNGPNKPELGDTVLVEAESVEGMLFKWNAKRVQVVTRNIPHNVGTLPNSDTSNRRTSSPSYYFSDVLCEKSATRQVGEQGEHFSQILDQLQKPLRNPPPPPNISKKPTRAHVHSTSRRSRSHSNERRQKVGRGRSPRTRETRRRNRSRSKSPTSENRRRSSMKQRSPRKPSPKEEEKKKLSFEELVFSDRSKEKPAVKKNISSTISSGVCATDIFKTATISKKKPSINIVPLSSTSRSLFKTKPLYSLPAFKVVNDVNSSYISSTTVLKSSLKSTRQDFSKDIRPNTNRNKSLVPTTSSAQNPVNLNHSNVNEKNLNDRRSQVDKGTKNQEPSRSLDRAQSNSKGKTHANSKQEERKSLPLPNTAYKVNSSKLDHRSIPINQLGNTKPATPSISRPISIRLGFVENRKKEQKLERNKLIDKPLARTTMQGSEVNWIQNLKNQNADNSTVRIASDLFIEQKDDEEYSKAGDIPQKKSLHTTGSNEPLRIQEQTIVFLNPIQTSSTRKCGLGENSRGNVQKQSDDKTAKNKVRGNRNIKESLTEIQIKSRGRKEYQERLRRMEKIRTTVKRRQLEIKKDKYRAPHRSSAPRVKNSRHRSYFPPHHRGNDINNIQETQQERRSPALPGQNSNAGEFLSEAEMIERERELERREQQLDEEQFRLEAEIAGLDSLGSQAHHFPVGRSNLCLPLFFENQINLSNSRDDRGSTHWNDLQPISRSISRSPDRNIEHGWRWRNSRSRSPLYHGRSSASPHVGRSYSNPPPGTSNLHRKRSLTPSNSRLESGWLQSNSSNPWNHSSRINGDESPVTRFRIDRRSPLRIAPPELECGENSNYRSHREHHRDPYQLSDSAESTRFLSQPGEFIQAPPYDERGFVRRDSGLSIEERRSLADAELMSEELGEVERRMFTGYFQSFPAFQDSIPYESSESHTPFVESQRFVWIPPAPDSSLQKKSVKGKPCMICRKKGHHENDCWHRSQL